MTVPWTTANPFPGYRCGQEIASSRLRSSQSCAHRKDGGLCPGTQDGFPEDLNNFQIRFEYTILKNITDMLR